MKILHVDSSILGPYSVSKQLSASTVAKLKTKSPDAAVTYRDLGDHTMQHLTGAYLGAGRDPGGDHTPEIKADLALGSAIMQEFLSADVIVIGVAFYNFGISSQLKAWVDRIVIVGQTFCYTAEGRPEGLVPGKRVIMAIARGGFYGAGSPIESFEHAETYLRTVFGFLGISNIETVAAEGIGIGPDQRATAIAAAELKISMLAA